MIGRRSELRFVRVCYSEFKAMWEEAIVRPGDMGFLREGTRVEESRLWRRKLEFVKDFVIRVPLASAGVMFSESTRQDYGR